MNKPEEQKSSMFKTLLENFTDDILYKSIVDTMETRLVDIMGCPVSFENDVVYKSAICTGETLQYTVTVPIVFKSYLFDRTKSTAVLKELERRLSKYNPHSVALFFHGLKEIMCIKVIILDI